MTDIDTLAQEADESPEDRTALVSAKLVDAELHVLPYTQWRSRGIHALNSGDFDVWAETCLTDESWEAWQQVDPTVDQITAFMRDFERNARHSLGKSSASPASSKPTARR